MIATRQLTGVFVSVFFYSGRSPCERRFSNLKPRPRCVRVRKLAGHLACPRVFPRTAADDARLPATRTCPVGHRRPRGLFVRLQRVRGEYARGRLSSPAPSNGCTKTDNGAVGIFNNVHHDKEKMQRRRRALAGHRRPTRDRGCNQRHRAAVGRASRAGNRREIYRLPRLLRPSMMTLDGRAGRGGMIIYNDVMMIAMVQPAHTHPTPGTTPVRATVARN